MRIIAGQHRGRSLLSPTGKATRPITSRVKTALFDILADTVNDAMVVDLFCGTGSIGLEALSRSARYCCFADRDRGAIVRLERNISAMGLSDRCRIWRGDIPGRLGRWLKQLPDPVDLAFVDPPYKLVNRWRWDEAVDRLFAPLAGKLAGEGVAVFRFPRETDLPETLGPLVVRDKRDYGQMSLAFLSLPKADDRGDISS